jgi:hypothetical protein
MSCDNNFAIYLDRNKFLDEFKEFLDEPEEEPVQNNQPLSKISYPPITSLESAEQNSAAVVFERTIHPEPQQHKRPAEPLVRTQANKRQKQNDPRLPLLKERRTELGISRAEICRRVNDHLKKLGSERPLALATLELIENNTTTKKTIDAYYNSINAVLDEAPKVLPAEIDPRPAYLKTLRTNAGLGLIQLSAKLRASGIKLSKTQLDYLEKGYIPKSSIDKYYDNIKNCLETFMSEENDNCKPRLLQWVEHKI